MNMNRVVTNGIELAYTDTGKGKPIIVLHGNSGTHKEMDLFTTTLSKTHRIISFDLRGHGLSDKGTQKYSINLLAKDIISACENLEINHCDMVGYSDGGNIVLTINTMKPDFIDHSVLVSPNYKVSGMKMSWIVNLNLLYILSSIGGLVKKTYGGYNSKMRLMVRDYKISPPELNTIISKTLILEAEKDMIKHKHLVNLNRLIEKSKLRIIRETSHFTIIKSVLAVDVILEFLLSD